MLPDIIKSYLYTQYNTDADLQALVSSYNELAQNVYDWLIQTPYPVFVGEEIGGDLLTWLVKGIYGVDRPVLVSERKYLIGTYNNVRYNILPYASFKRDVSYDFPVYDDDLFKRILTWNFYRGDGFNFTVRWLKRRIMRFLTGSFGRDIPNDSHFSVSVTFSEDEVFINVQKEYRTLKGDGLFNRLLFNAHPYNDISTSSYSVGDYPYAPLFQKAFQSGLLHMPFYLKKVTINVAEE